MPLPKIDIDFSTLAASAITRSARGIVAVILRDDTQEATKYEYKTVADITATDWTTDNLQQIKLVFRGYPSKVVAIRGATTDTDYNAQLTALQNLKWNWLTVPGIASSDATDVASWIVSQRALRKTFKAVLPNTAADNEGIVNFTTEGNLLDGVVYSAADFASRVAGLLGGLSLSRSATYFELTDVDGITESADPDTDIDDGKFILITQNDAVKVARGVNSFTSTTVDKAAQYQKIKIVEGMDLIKDDIMTTFNDSYVGKVINSYDNQVLFITAVNAYLKGLEGTVLDPDYDNVVGIDVEAQRSAWNEAGTDTTDMTDQQVKEMSYSSNVYLDGVIKFLDAMEDLKLSFTLV